MELWFALDLNSYYNVYGVDILQESHDQKFNLVYIELNVNYPSHQEYNLEKREICSYLNENHNYPKFSTYLCDNGGSKGQFVILKTDYINPFYIKLRKIEVFGKLIKDISEFYFIFFYIFFKLNIISLFKFFCFIFTLDDNVNNIALYKPVRFDSILRPYSSLRSFGEKTTDGRATQTHYFHSLDSGNVWFLIDLLGSFQVKTMGVVHRDGRMLK